MSQHARGKFDVQTIPQGSGDKGPGSHLSRLSLDKQFHGELEAVGKGEMLAAMTEVEGSAAYVAIERVTGTLQGRAGSFALQHFGSMIRGAPQMTINVVPDSGAGALVGMTGTLTITVVEGQHWYDLEYSLPKSA